jgi:hypothetical protein
VRQTTTLLADAVPVTGVEALLWLGVFAGLVIFHALLNFVLQSRTPPPGRGEDGCQA